MELDELDEYIGMKFRSQTFDLCIDASSVVIINREETESGKRE
jgi:hypothetical protein